MITTISNQYLCAQIKHQGAELCSLKDQASREYMWDANPAFWAKHSPILFPIVGSLKNNTYHYNNENYELSRHGFARDMKFELAYQTASSATFSLKANKDTKIKYPFDFELQLIYTLEGPTLYLHYKVINQGNTLLPFSIGAHPAFDLAGNFEDYSLLFEKEEKLQHYLLEDGLITNNTNTLSLDKNELYLSRQLFEKDALIFKKIASKSLSIAKKSKPFLKLDYADFPDLGIWTAPNAPFICLEPWFGYADTLEAAGPIFEKEGIEIIEPKAVFQSRLSIEIL